MFLFPLFVRIQERKEIEMEIVILNLSISVMFSKKVK